MKKNGHIREPNYGFIGDAFVFKMTKISRAILYKQ